MNNIEHDAWFGELGF